ncbi:hypothetical protein SHLO109777_12745 [Shewanella loihica]|uniref:Lipoprotein n=1 Tax=Shewanella loihica (strain ATCC BAA-1088 / PV-4) TaxID=323850 RepID=A3QA38_SHELP|nr:hypothetical protein [Shewanella loihica]ABO22336.1 hypothetical protein Shew_0464 [Shewanella loihica PV-4]
MARLFLFTLFAASLLITGILSGCANGHGQAQDPSQTQSQSSHQAEQQELGAMVQALQQAIATPSPEQLEVIARYGTDSRYYVMVRGWLVQELSGIESQLAAQGDGAPETMRAKAEHLRAAIRRIDLE